MNAAARGQITFNEAQKGEDTFYLRLSPSTLAMSNEVTAEDEAVTPSRDWYEKYRASLRLMRGDTNVSGYITRLRIYDTSGTLVYDSSLSTQPTTGDVLMSALLQNVVNPVTSRGETYYLLNFRKFDVEAPCEGKMDIYVNASIPAEEGSAEMIPFEDYITLSYSVEDNVTLSGLEYLIDRLKDGRTDVLGGLILSSAIALGRYEDTDSDPSTDDVFVAYSGMNGDMSVSEIAAWYGGDMIDKYDPNTDITTDRYAQSLFRFDGSGYLSGGKIRWDENGNLILDGNIKLADSTGDTLTQFIDVVANLNNMFELRNVGTTSNPEYAIKALYPLYTDGWLSAFGISSSGSGGDGGDTTLAGVWESLKGPTQSYTDAYSNEKINIAHIPAFTVSKLGTGNVVSDMSYANGVFSLTMTNVSSDWDDITNKPDLVTTSSLSATLAYYVPINRTINGKSLAANVTLTKSDIGLDDVQNIDIRYWQGSGNITTLGTISTGTWNGDTIANAKLVGGGKITIGSTELALGDSTTLTDLGVPVWAQNLNALKTQLSQVYHPLHGDAAIYFRASTLTTASSITVGNAAQTDSDKRIYFGSSSNYIELKNIAASGQAPVYAFHFSHGLYSDGFVSAYGRDTSGGDTPSGGGTEHIILSESEFNALQTVDNGVIYMVYEDEEVSS